MRQYAGTFAFQCDRRKRTAPIDVNLAVAQGDKIVSESSEIFRLRCQYLRNKAAGSVGFRLGLAAVLVADFSFSKRTKGV